MAVQRRLSHVEQSTHKSFDSITILKPFEHTLRCLPNHTHFLLSLSCFFFNDLPKIITSLNHCFKRVTMFQVKSLVLIFFIMSQQTKNQRVLKESHNIPQLKANDLVQIRIEQQHRFKVQIMHDNYINSGTTFQNTKCLVFPRLYAFYNKRVFENILLRFSLFQ